MIFEPGQRVIIEKNLGTQDSCYYHGEYISNIPLGTKATVDHIESENKVCLIRDGVDIRGSGGLNLQCWVHPDEISISQDEKDRRLELGDRVKIVSARNENEYYAGYPVSKIPLGTTGVVSKAYDQRLITVRVKIANLPTGSRIDYSFLRSEIAYDENTNVHDLNPSRLTNLLETEEPISENKGIEQKIFQPKFNVREEFAIWVRGQFPQLKEHSRTETDYPALIDRENEIMQEAQKAYAHINSTETHGCTLTTFEQFFNKLTRGNGNFIINLEKFVGLIESTSANLSAAYKHHGTQLSNRRGI